MATVELEPKWGELRTEPQRGPGAEHLSEYQGAKPYEAEKLSVFACPTETANLPHYTHFANLACESTSKRDLPSRWRPKAHPGDA